MAKMIGAKKILEIGTLGAYSTIWMGRALPSDGKLITLEYDAKHAQIARQNIARAGLDKLIQVRLGKALDTLPALEAEKAGPFDLIFIDADKPATADYFKWAMNLIRPGGLILVDNVVRKGQVVDAHSKDTDVQGIRRFNVALAAQKGVTATALQTVGSKGYDGIALVLVDQA
jgi:predicted O-methyltransferase YrrM